MFLEKLIRNASRNHLILNYFVWIFLLHVSGYGKNSELVSICWVKMFKINQMVDWKLGITFLHWKINKKLFIISVQQTCLNSLKIYLKWCVYVSVYMNLHRLGERKRIVHLFHSLHWPLKAVPERFIVPVCWPLSFQDLVTSISENCDTGKWSHSQLLLGIWIQVLKII